jgi:signal transduction histidine kinase
MTRRLVLSYVGLAFLILLVLEIPLAVLASRHEHDLTAGQVEREASGLAAVTSEDVENGQIADLNAILDRYHARTGGEIFVVNPGHQVVARSAGDSDNDAAGEDRGLVQAALAGRSATSFGSDEGQPWATAAVPLNIDGRPQWALLLGLAASSTERRVHEIWLSLAGLAAGVLVLTLLVGMLLARSLSRPLAHLESAVTRLGQGNLATRARTDDGPPQVRSLATQFNHMAVRLAELVDVQSRFVADASHQLRSPLTALRLRLENLEANADGPTADDMAAAGREVQRLSRVVDGLLTLNRAEGTTPDPRPVNVAEVIEERCEAWSALAEEHRAHLHAECPAGARPVAMLVPGDLDQILDNLLANAVDASPAGGRIRVNLAGGEPGSLELHVIDEGPGMAAEDRRRAFDRFWQGPGAARGNSGLGLAIVRQLVMRNDASVELRPAQPTGLDVALRMKAIVGLDGRSAARRSQPSAVGPGRTG